MAAAWSPGAGTELFLMQDLLYECRWDHIAALLLHVCTDV